jgi:hypothetical protein
MRCVPQRVLFLPLLCIAALATLQASQSPAPDVSPDGGLTFIDTSLENGSPAWYERGDDGVYLLHLLYDHERGAANRAAGHIHVRLVGTPGARVTIEFRNLDNIWNGRPGSVAGELTTVAISPDARTWTTVPTDALPGNRVRVTLTMPGDTLYLARMQPYRLSDLEVLLASVRTHPDVEVTAIGQTVLGRPLELLRIGDERVPRRVFVRARAHPWEAGSSWVAQGLIMRLLAGDAEARAWRGRYALYVLPMANKDGVARGMTRFNVIGADLNRNWDRPANPDVAPENAALERWLERMIAAGQAPDLAIELHNDGRGLLHLSRAPVPQLDRYLVRMARLEALLRAHTWFTEGHTAAAFRNSGTLGDGWLERYGIDALVHELNANRVEGRRAYTSAALWQEYGAALAGVLDTYLAELQP